MTDSRPRFAKGHGSAALLRGQLVGEPATVAVAVAHRSQVGGVRAVDLLLVPRW